MNNSRISCNELTTAGSAPIAVAVNTISTNPPGEKLSKAVGISKSENMAKR